MLLSTPACIVSPTHHPLARPLRGMRCGALFSSPASSGPCAGCPAWGRPAFRCFAPGRGRASPLAPCPGGLNPPFDGRAVRVPTPARPGVSALPRPRLLGRLAGPLSLRCAGIGVVSLRLSSVSGVAGLGDTAVGAVYIITAAIRKTDPPTETSGFVLILWDAFRMLSRCKKKAANFLATSFFGNMNQGM